MGDNLSKEDRRKNMKAIRSTRTKLEDRVTKDLWRKGIRYRRNVKSLIGKPDISIKKYKVVIFIDSCFWHGCKLHGSIPETNRKYWIDKINRNRRRDTEVTKTYQSMGWYIKRVWEHELKDNFEGSVEEIVDFIRKAKQANHPNFGQ